MRKKLVSILLMMTLVLGSTGFSRAVPVRADETILPKEELFVEKELTPIRAAEEVPSAEEPSDTGLSQEKMSEVILAVKNRAQVDDSKYTVFDYNYWEENGIITWNFNWASEDGKESLYISSDNEGHISSYQTYGSNNDTGAPAYTRSELQPKAEEMIKQLMPEAESKVVFNSSYYNQYNCSYTYSYYRYENAIPMPDNSISISISAKDGTLTSMNSNWLCSAEFILADKLITKDEAASIIGKKVTMELQYCIGYAENSEGEYEPKAFLAYIPDNLYLAVDAVSGKVYTEKVEWERGTENKAFDAYDMMEEESPKAATASGAVLTDEEIKKIEELPDYISKEEAVSKIMGNDKLLIDENTKSVSASLRKTNEKYVWRVRMEDSRPVNYEINDTYRAYISANVDAVTGEIISFSSSVKDMYEYTEEELAGIKINYTKKQCQNKMAEFAKEQNPERFASTKLTENIGDYAINIKEDEKPNYGGYRYNYTRVNEDIPFYSNRIRGAVDAITGKIYSYSYNWNDDIELPSPESVIDSKTALSSYLGFDGFDLVYELNTVYGYDELAAQYDEYQVTHNIRLVYRTDISPYYVDAFTGKQLQYDGEEYNKAATEYKYTDIQGTKYERQIELLADMGVGFETTEFKPSKVITRTEFQQLADKLEMYYYDEKISGDRKLTRQAAAKTVIRMLGLEKTAELTGIFTTGYDDEEMISEELKGYIALAKGYNILGASSKNIFKPGSGITRGEAADILLKLMKAR